MTKEPKHRLYSFTVNPDTDPQIVRYMDRLENISEAMRALLRGKLSGDLASIKDLTVMDKQTRIALNRLKIWEVSNRLGFTQERTEKILSGQEAVPVPELLDGSRPPELGARVPVKVAPPADFERRRAALKQYIEDGGDILELGPECFTFGGIELKPSTWGELPAPGGADP